MLWINFLHFYQPANIEKEKIIEAAEKSYFYILDCLEKNPKVKFTINLSGCLLLRFDEDLKYQPLIERFARLFSRGQLEIAGTAAYHPLLPLIRGKVAIEQIKEQEKILKKFFDCPRPRGFFFPEMAYSPEAAKMIKRLEYEWIILDEISAGQGLGKIDTSKIYLDKNSGLKVVFRNRRRSSGYIPKHLLEDWGKLEGKTLITATDAELYGLKHNDHSRNFAKLLSHDKLKTASISEYIDCQKEPPEELKIVSSSWETTAEELKRGEAFSLWSGSDKIHVKLWKLANLAQKQYLKHKSEASAPEPGASYWSYWHLARGLSSCGFWWASGKDFSHSFGPKAWSPDEVEKGVNELTRSIRSLEKLTDLKTKLKAEKMALEIKKLIWEKHWRGE
ncbi:MAG: hypothetical protein WCW77_03555 [Patescibacteria group bacterium]|jgi:predicted glycosyl hydrolase (DUF1957 family)